MAPARAEGVNAYIARQSSDAQAVLRRVRGIIRKVLPKAEETISYRIPAYKVAGRAVVYFAGWKRHWSLYPVTGEIRAKLGRAVGGYAFSKGTMRFPLDEPVPVKLVERVVRAMAGRPGLRPSTDEGPALRSSRSRA